MKLSVIIPVYNCEQYLDKCIQSVLNQTFADFECILVDDGSTDKSGEICNSYANIDKRFKVFHISNGGVSNARNYGLSKATGEFVTFIDSDDFVDEDTFFFCLQYTSQYDVVCYGMDRVSKEKHFAVKYMHTNICDDFIKYPVYMNSVCNKFFRKYILDCNQIMFNSQLKGWEDMLFAFQALNCSRKNMFLLECKYHYRVNSNSATKSKVDLNQYFLHVTRVYAALKTICDNLHIDNEYKKLLNYWKMKEAMLYLNIPEIYSPKKYREINSEKLVWSDIHSFDHIIATFFSNYKIDCFSFMFMWLRKLYYLLKS